MRRVGSLLLSVLLLAGCGDPPPPEVTPALLAQAQRQWPAATTDELQRGRQLLLTRCTECHGVRQPAAHQPREWQAYFNEMAPKARLDELERSDLTRYVLSAQSLTPEPKP